MKSAIVSAFKAFISQMKDNRLEMAIKTVEKNGYAISRTEIDRTPIDRTPIDKTEVK